jgi:hypothetical protein
MTGKLSGPVAAPAAAFAEAYARARPPHRNRIFRVFPGRFPAAFRDLYAHAREGLAAFLAG